MKALVGAFNLEDSEGPSRGLLRDYEPSDIPYSSSAVQIINVGGERHEVTFQTLAKLPQTRLAKLRGATSQAELNMLCDR